MLLIIVSWLYVTFTCINLGTLFKRAFKIQSADFAVTALFGLFVTTITASAWAIFSRINYEFHLALLAVNLLVFIILKADILQQFKACITKFKKLNQPLQWLLILSTLLIIAQSATAPYVIDNESYYIQSVKWVNEYGFVKGLGNLHFFLAQMSGWHVTQGAFSFSFLYDNFNDISAYCLWLGNVFSIARLNAYFTNKNFSNLVIGLFPLANVFFFQFISAPSPDIPVYVISFIVFSYFLKKEDDVKTRFVIIVILSIYMMYIKTTAIALLFIPIYLLAIHYKKLLGSLPKLAVIGVTVLCLFLIKNIIISGYPFFPVINISYPADWCIPEKIAQLYYDDTKLYGFLLSNERYEAMSAGKLFLRWLTLPKLHGLFNKICVLLLLISPVIIYKYKNERKWWVLYIAMVLQMIMLYMASPQYRFFMNFLLLFSFFIAAVIFIKYKKVVMPLLYVSVFVSAYVLFVPLDLNKFSQNKFALSTSNFSAGYIVSPHSNTKFDTGFKKVAKGNLTFYSPLQNNFLWASGNGPLPCVNTDQIKRFEKKYNVVPQLRGKSLKEGFYATETKR